MYRLINVFCGVIMWIYIVCTLVAVTSCHEVHKVRVDVMGQSVMINCSTDLSKVNNVDYWLVPNNGRDIALDGYDSNGLKITNDGWTVQIERVADDHLGLYLCRTTRNGDVQYTESDLFLYIPTFLEVYETNLIIGASAAGAMLVLSSLFCIIHSCRYSQRKKDEEYKLQQQQGYPSHNHSGIEVQNSTLDRTEFHNAAYENVDMEELKRVPNNEEDTVVSVDKESIPDKDGMTTM